MTWCSPLYKPIYNYTGQRLLLDGVFTKQIVPWSVYNLFNGLTTPEVISAIFALQVSASSQIPNPFDKAAIVEKQAYWNRWLYSLPLQANLSNSNSTLLNLSANSVISNFAFSDDFSKDFN